MAASNDDDPVFGHGASGSHLNTYRDALLADDPHNAYDHTHDRRNSIGITVGAVVGLALVGSIFWYVYNRLPSVAPTEIPVLQAVPEAVKVRPDTPGGLDVPNRDKLIYQQMGEASVASGSEEHLLPPIETPAEPPESEPVRERGGEKKDMSSSAQTEAPHRLDSDLGIPTVTMIGPPKGSFPKAVTSPVTPSVPAPVAIAAPPIMLLAPPGTVIRPERPVSSLSELIARRVKLPPVHRTLEGKSSTALPVISPAAPATVASSASSISPISKAVVSVPQSTGPREGVRLQLGSFKNTEDAEKAWLQLVSRHGDLLSGTVHTLAQVDLGVKGSWYRVYAGPYSDMRAALSVCYALKQRSVGCVFTRK